PPARTDHVDLLPVTPKALGTVPGANAGAGAHYTHLAAVPIVSRLVMIVIREEMEVVEQQSLHPRIVQMGTHTVHHHWEIILVHHFIGLQIEGPISGARLQRDVR